jgi:hypothetical protein
LDFTARFTSGGPVTTQRIFVSEQIRRQLLLSTRAGSLNVKRMAVNHADGTLFTSMLLCPIAAGVGAVQSGAGWTMVLFVPVGFAIGVAIFRYCRRPLYAITGYGINVAAKMPRGWMRQVVSLPFFLFYILLPMAIVWVAVLGIWAGSIWLVRQVL